MPRLFLILVRRVIDGCMEQNGWTALLSAAQSGQTECAQLLLQSGAEMDAKNNVRTVCAYLVRMSGDVLLH